MPPYTMHFLNAFLLTVVLISVLDRVAARIGLLDFPQGRKVHEHAVPATGGLAMFGAFLLPVINLQLPLHVSWDFLIGASLLVLIGAIDDMRALGPWTKLGGQILAVLIMTLPGGHLISPDAFLGITGAEIPGVKAGLRVCFAIGLVNAFNMLDGLDGLAGGAAAAALMWLAMVAGLSGITGAFVQLLILICAVLGFLVFNLRHPWRGRASVYMGDAGSMMLGAAVAFFTIDLSTGPEKAAPFPALLWFSAVPVFDTLILIVRRVATGNNPLCGDRRHLHHILLKAGISPRTAAGILITACLLLGGVGLAGWRLGIPTYLMLLGLLLPFMLHLYVVLHGWKLVAQLCATRGANGVVPLHALSVLED